jgi:hypothetical protein
MRSSHHVGIDVECRRSLRAPTNELRSLEVLSRGERRRGDRGDRGAFIDAARCRNGQEIKKDRKSRRRHWA